MEVLFRFCYSDQLPETQTSSDLLTLLHLSDRYQACHPSPSTHMYSAYANVCIHACLCISYVFMLRMYIKFCMHVHVYVYVYVHVYVYVCFYGCLHMCMCVCTMVKKANTAS